ncbi:MAG: 3-phosphoshikimate 1-carboxyvinyltransferase [Nitrososphaeraceae archaeon]
MNNIKVTKSTLNGSITCPSSKSYTHRVVSIASLVNDESIIKNPLLSRDTLATIEGCLMLGTKIDTKSNNQLNIFGSKQLQTPDNVIDAKNSGTTIRILTSMTSLVKNGYTVLTGDDSLRKRPMSPLLDSLNQLGVECFSTNSTGNPPILVKAGGIKGGYTTIDGSISSQFISSLLISSVYADSDVTIEVIGQKVSTPYIDSTISTMKEFGITVNHDNYQNYYLTPSEYKSNNFTIPGDFSSASLLISAGVLSGDTITINGLNFDYPQGDLAILDIVKEMHGNINISKQNGSITIYGSDELNGIDCNLVNTPDLLPVVSILALKATSKVSISGISHARLKETDRVQNITRELRKLGVLIDEKQDEIIITPVKSLKNATLNSYGDHRLFMAFTIAGLLTRESIIQGVDSIDVSYPDFINHIKKLGGNLQLL